MQSVRKSDYFWLSLYRISSLLLYYFLLQYALNFSDYWFRFSNQFYALSNLLFNLDFGLSLALHVFLVRAQEGELDVKTIIKYFPVVYFVIVSISFLIILYTDVNNYFCDFLNVSNVSSYSIFLLFSSLFTNALGLSWFRSRNEIKILSLISFFQDVAKILALFCLINGYINLNIFLTVAAIINLFLPAYVLTSVDIRMWLLFFNLELKIKEIRNFLYQIVQLAIPTFIYVLSSTLFLMLERLNTQYLDTTSQNAYLVVLDLGQKVWFVAYILGFVIMTDAIKGNALFDKKLVYLFFGFVATYYVVIIIYLSEIFDFLFGLEFPPQLRLPSIILLISNFSYFVTQYMYLKLIGAEKVWNIGLSYIVAGLLAVVWMECNVKNYLNLAISEFIFFIGISLLLSLHVFRIRFKTFKNLFLLS